MALLLQSAVRGLLRRVYNIVVNQTFLEPDVSYNFKSGWYVRCEPSITYEPADSTCDWREIGVQATGLKPCRRRPFGLQGGLKSEGKMKIPVTPSAIAIVAATALLFLSQRAAAGDTVSHTIDISGVSRTYLL